MGSADFKFLLRLNTDTYKVGSGKGLRALLVVVGVIVFGACGCSRVARTVTASELTDALHGAQRAGAFVCIFTYDDEFTGLDGSRRVSSTQGNLTSSEAYKHGGARLDARVRPSACPSDDACQGFLFVIQGSNATTLFFVRDQNFSSRTVGCFATSELEIAGNEVRAVNSQ